MNTRPKNGSNGLSKEWVKTHLRLLSDVAPPETLRRKLRADAAHAAAVGPGESGAHRWSRAIRYVGVTAAVVAVTCAIVRLGLPPGRPQDPVADHNEDVSLALAADYNSLGPLDTNVCDNNGLH